MSGEVDAALLKVLQSLDESTTTASVPGSISACIMEIFRMSETLGFSELDSACSFAAASPLLLDTGGGPNVILVTAAPCVMIVCCTYHRKCSKHLHNFSQICFYFRYCVYACRCVHSNLAAAAGCFIRGDGMVGLQWWGLRELCVCVGSVV